MNKITAIPSKIFLHLTVFLLSKLKTKQKAAKTINSPVISNILNPRYISSPTFVIQ
ncbi:hypothetical protein [uncultured Lactobacillus sp.]|uniref:hypothetical protein n=1 Tax=uncultured Lactobacillus sp. TaxID=153152 RepID=UPI0025E510FA|nr:hypothetical protein [uncultured Lactobacillus sp.]